jgi:hypothetical protein
MCSHTNAATTAYVRLSIQRCKGLNPRPWNVYPRE